MLAVKPVLGVKTHGYEPSFSNSPFEMESGQIPVSKRRVDPGVAPRPHLRFAGEVHTAALLCQHHDGQPQKEEVGPQLHHISEVVRGRVCVCVCMRADETILKRYGEVMMTRSVTTALRCRYSGVMTVDDNTM